MEPLRKAEIRRRPGLGATNIERTFNPPFKCAGAEPPKVTDTYSRNLTLASQLNQGLFMNLQKNRRSFELRTLAEEAGLSEKSVRSGLKGLAERKLVRSLKSRRRATRYALLDPRPGSLGWDLGDLGRFHRQSWNVIPAHDRYKELLRDCDPHGLLTHGPTEARILCPFCKMNRKRKAGFSKPQKPSLYVNSRITDMEKFAQEDHWSCAGCRRSGDPPKGNSS